MKQYKLHDFRAPCPTETSLLRECSYVFDGRYLFNDSVILLFVSESIVPYHKITVSIYFGDIVIKGEECSATYH